MDLQHWISEKFGWLAGTWERAVEFIRENPQTVLVLIVIVTACLVLWVSYLFLRKFGKILITATVLFGIVFALVTYSR